MVLVSVRGLVEPRAIVRLDPYKALHNTRWPLRMSDDIQGVSKRALQL
jgi:hypothetical protein